MQTSLLKRIWQWSVASRIRLPHGHMERMGELWFLKQILEHLEVDCVLDVGANIGQYSRELRGIGYKGHIVSFEPIASVFKALSQEFASDAKWRGFQLALGAENAELTINVPRLTVMSSLLPSQHAQRDMREELVSVRRLDSMLPGLKGELGVKRIFLKMDTQGYDLEAFKGTVGAIAGIVGLQSELSVQPLYKGMPHYVESLQAYEAAGFELYNLSVVNRVESGGLLELNCFMRRPEC